MILEEGKRKELDEIIEQMNKHAELKMYYPEDSPEWQRSVDALTAYAERVRKMPEPERTYVEQGLIGRKDIHDVYWPDYEARSKHEKQRRASKVAGDQEGESLNEYRRT